MMRLTDRYLAALVSHDPGAAPLAPDVRTVENLQQIQPGEGLWTSLTGGPSAFAVHVIDPGGQAAGFIGVLESDGAPILLGLRLKMAEGQIIETEHLVATELSEASLANLHTPHSSLLGQIPADRQLPVHELREIAATYYAALDDGEGSLAPFAADCERHENGFLTGGPNYTPRTDSRFPAVATDCAAQIDSGVFTYIASIDNRRVFAADPMTGLAMGLSQFRHPMDNVPYEVALPNGSTTMFAPEFDPFDLPAAHIFKIGADRRIHTIAAMGFRAPYASPTGW